MKAYAMVQIRSQFYFTWYAQFPWLEYSKEIDDLYCFACFLFDEKKAKYPKFTIKGFTSWKKINNRERCSSLHH